MWGIHLPVNFNINRNSCSTYKPTSVHRLEGIMDFDRYSYFLGKSGVWSFTNEHLSQERKDVVFPFKCK